MCCCLFASFNNFLLFCFHVNVIIVIHYAYAVCFLCCLIIICVHLCVSVLRLRMENEFLCANLIHNVMSLYLINSSSHAEKEYTLTLIEYRTENSS